ncbi:MAG: N-acetylmuramoyl-L-alanine amidase [Planctomycetota bacterium]
MKVVLDPGHGGSMPAGKSSNDGVAGPEGTLERTVNLAIAQRARDVLGPSAVLTRGGGDNPSLAQRAARAAAEEARAFVSIHANGGVQGTRGAEIWLHDAAGEPSRELARFLQGELAKLKTPVRGIHRGPLAVLAPEALGAVPGCLVEVDYLTDPGGEARLTDEDHQRAIGAAIAEAINGFLLHAEGGPPAAHALIKPSRESNTHVVPNRLPSNPDNYSFLQGGSWNSGTSLSLQGGQAMWFKIRNANVLGTTIEIRDDRNQIARSIILPQQEVNFVFTTFGAEPMGWRFNVRSESSAFLVTWELKSTWVPGDPPNG